MTHDQEISAATRTGPTPFRSFMLSEDDPRVMESFEKLKGRELPEVEVKESLTSGCTWPQSHGKHQTARQQMARRLGVEAIARIAS